MTRKIVVDILDCLMTFTHALSLRLVYSAVSFSNTEASMRAIFNGMCAGRAVHRETEVHCPRGPLSWNTHHAPGGETQFVAHKDESTGAYVATSSAQPT